MVWEQVSIYCFGKNTIANDGVGFEFVSIQRDFIFLKVFHKQTNRINMPPPTPTSTETINIPTFGDVKGLVYPSGARQFRGIPYAKLTKRWTRSVLNTSLPDGFHDGTQHG